MSISCSWSTALSDGGIPGEKPRISTCSLTEWPSTWREQGVLTDPDSCLLWTSSFYFLISNLGRKKKDTKQKHSAANIMSCFKQQNKQNLFLLPAGQNKRQLSQIGNLARFWIWEFPQITEVIRHIQYEPSACVHTVSLQLFLARILTGIKLQIT